MELESLAQIGHYGKSATHVVCCENRVLSLSLYPNSLFFLHSCVPLWLSAGRPCVLSCSLSEQTEMRGEEWDTHPEQERDG